MRSRLSAWFRTAGRWFQIPAWTGAALTAWRLVSEVDTAVSVASWVMPDDEPPPEWLANVLASPYLPLALGIVWFTVAALIATRKPRRRRAVELYPTHKDLEELGGGLDQDCREADQVWAAFESGDYYYQGIDDALRPKIRRMILLHPDSPHIAYLSRFSEIGENAIRDQIRLTTKQAVRVAEEHDVEVAVRWSMDPLLNCVIGTGRSERPRFARVQVFCPHSWTKNWPNLKITRAHDRETLDRLVEAYERMWERSVPPEPLKEPEMMGRLLKEGADGYEALGAGVRRRGGSIEIDDDLDDSDLGVGRANAIDDEVRHDPDGGSLVRIRNLTGRHLTFTAKMVLDDPQDLFEPSRTTGHARGKVYSLEWAESEADNLPLGPDASGTVLVLRKKIDEDGKVMLRLPDNAAPRPVVSRSWDQSEAPPPLELVVTFDSSPSVPGLPVDLRYKVDSDGLVQR